MSNSKNIHISGMTCANCAKGIEKHLNSKGIKDIIIDFPNSEARFIESGRKTICNQFSFYNTTI